jgi:hypothetical protein
MPHTVRVRASLAKHVLASGDTDLLRRIGILREVPFPPGSRSMVADDDWHELATIFPGRRGFVYGSIESAIVYTYDASTEILQVEFGVSEGRIVGRAE